MVRLSSFLEVINEFYREPYNPSLEKQLDPFSRGGGGVPVFSREPIGTCGFPDGVGPDTLPSTLNQSMHYG